MKDLKLKIEKNIQVGYDTYLMTLTGDLSEIKNSGEFINITIPGYYLRRPISVCDYSSKHVDILYKILGRGTKDLSCFEDGIYLDCLVGLGNGFTVKENIKPLLVAGGIGIAPLVGLAKAFNKIGIKPTLVYGARSHQDIVLKEELEKLTDLYICTDDGSLGFKGNVIECIKHHNSEQFFVGHNFVPSLLGLPTLPDLRWMPQSAHRFVVDSMVSNSSKLTSGFRRASNCRFTAVSYSFSRCSAVRFPRDTSLVNR